MNVATPVGIYLLTCLSLMSSPVPSTSEVQHAIDQSEKKALESLGSHETRKVEGTRLVTVGDRSAEVVAQAGTGPTVVFEAGAGVGLTAWIEFARTLEPSIPWVCYSRAGYRGSTAVPGERTPVVIARELHELLDAARIAPPYILVGHSFGGVCSRTFVALYPNEVVGVVLDDPAYEAANIDLKRIAPSLFGTLTAVPPTTPAMLKAELRGMDTIYETGRLNVNEPDLPTVVLTALGPPKGIPASMEPIMQALTRAKMEAHTVLVAGRTRGLHLTSEKTAHSFHADEPARVREAIDWIRSGR